MITPLRQSRKEKKDSIPACIIKRVSVLYSGEMNLNAGTQ